MIPAAQLAPYLPHALNFYVDGDIWTLYSMSIDGAVVLKKGSETIVVHEHNVGVQCKPIFRPFDSWKPEDSLNQEEAIGKRLPSNQAHATFSLQAAIDANFYFKHKFDVFALIEQGLAEDLTKLST